MQVSFVLILLCKNLIYIYSLFSWSLTILQRLNVTITNISRKLLKLKYCI